MIRYLIISIFFASSMLVSAQADNAVKYSDQIIYQNSFIQKSIGELIDTYDQYLPEKMDSAYVLAEKTINEGILYVDSLGDFHGDNSFRVGAIKLFDNYKYVLENYHKKLIALLKLPEAEYGDKQIEEFGRLINESHEFIDAEIDKLIAIHKKFAERHEFLIED